MQKRKKLAEQKKRKKKARKQKVKGISPFQEQLTSLLEHYQNGRFDDAETSIINIGLSIGYTYNFTMRLLQF